MPSKIIFRSASSAEFPWQKSRRDLYAYRRAQRGITLVELMVGIAIGLLVIAVAMGDERAQDRSRRIDPAIGGDDMDAVRFGANPCEGRGHER